MIFQLISEHPAAILEIIKRTPVWVWGLLAALLALGVSQLREQQRSLGRVIGLPVGMSAFGIYGLWTAFGGSPQQWPALLAWLATALVASALMLWLPEGSNASQGEFGKRSAPRFNAGTGQLSIPGSVMPLLLILGIFMTKYVVGVEMAINPQAAHGAGFALGIGSLYGAFSGFFAGRTLRLWRLVRQAGALAAGSGAVSGAVSRQLAPAA